MQPCIIIQARMTSERLPGKILLPLAGSTVLGALINRLGSLRKNVVIATTNDGSEEPITTWCEQENIPYVCGDTENVLSRYLLAAESVGAKGSDILVRLTSDCPLIDADIVQRIIDVHVQTGADYTSNTINRTFPRGLDTEVFSAAALQTVQQRAELQRDKEHVTSYMHLTAPHEFHIEHYCHAENHSQYRITVDEVDDYRVVKEVYELFHNRYDFSYAELIAAMQAHPEIALRNQHIEQKKT